jgi:hypothetical protein
MKTLIICKSKDTYDKYRAGLADNEAFTILLYKEDDLPICGLRAQHVIALDDWTVKELREVILPFLVTFSLSYRLQQSNLSDQIQKIIEPNEPSSNSAGER